MIKAYFIESESKDFLDYLNMELKEHIAVKGIYTHDMNPKETLESIELFLENK